MKTRITTGLALAIVLGACNSGSAPQARLQHVFATLGELEDAIALSPAADRDGDSIPDDIEVLLDTDPENRDSDRDGLVDNFELFAPGWERGDPLPDADNDGLLSAVDADEDGDRINDGTKVDTDGDGVPNALEFYGYSYDFLTGQFRRWNGDPSVPHFFTDPLQPSTDQDAYPDGMEVSGLLLDPTVRYPGDHPLVPAYPNLVVELASYTVTLNETIQLTETQSFERGRSWTRQTERTHSHTNEFNWGVGGKVGYEGGASPKVTGEVSVNFGGSYSATNSVAVSVGTGDSITSAEGWSVARTSNPTEAAHVKLLLKIRNRGTAPISNVVPTLTLKIGGLNVRTFEPGNPQVHMLVPGASYPDEPGVYWVVDSVAGGGPLSLTMSELRALERGAPISVSMTQVRGDAMRLTPEGAWQSIGATTEFVARCDAVCANIRIDLGDDALAHDLDGALVQHRVYGDDGASARATTLGEALARIGVDEEGTLFYVDRDGFPRTRSLDGFTYAIDPATLRANGWTVEADGTVEAPEGFALSSMRILPDTTILIRAPRTPGAAPGPQVHFAYLDPFDGEVLVSAADYEGIRSVTVHNEDKSRVIELFESVPGSGFYAGTADREAGFDAADRLFAEVVNLAGEMPADPVALGSLFREPEPQPPVIHTVELDLNAHRIYVNVESGNPNNANSDIEWVRLYHPDLPGGFTDEFRRVFDYYKDEQGLEADLPASFKGEDDLTVVAYVAPGVFTERDIAPGDITNVQVRRTGTVTMRSDWDQGPFTIASRIGRLILDAPPGARYYRFTEHETFSGQLHPIPVSPDDLVLRVDTSAVFISSFPAQMFFNAQSEHVGDGNLLYRGLTKGEIENAMLAGDSPRKVDAPGGLERNQVYALRTTAGLYAKIYVTDIAEEYSYFDKRKTWKVTLKFVVFEP